MTITTGPTGATPPGPTPTGATGPTPTGTTGRAADLTPRLGTTPKTSTYAAGRVSARRALVVAGLLVGVGSLFDVLVGRGPGFGLTTGFLIACLAIAVWLRVQALATAVISPPLLFAAATTLIALASGQSNGSRQVGLDVATSLALSAPVLFTGTLGALAITLVRVVWHLTRRSHS